MDIAVCVKTNPDLQLMRVKDRMPVLEAVPFKVGDLEKNALEAALKLRDAAGGGRIVAVAVSQGDRKLRETMKEALAIGADEAVLVSDPALDDSDQAGVALALARALEKAGPFDLVLFGEGSTDGYSGQVPSRVAELLGLPEIGYARSLEIAGAVLRAERSMGENVETLESPLPAAATGLAGAANPSASASLPAMRNMLPLTTTVWLPPSDCVIYADSPCLSVTFVPTGTTEASTSRVKIFASLEFIKHLSNQSLPVSSPQSRVKSIRSVRFLCSPAGRRP